MQNDMSRDEVEDRKRNFLRTIKTNNWGTVLINALFGIIFLGYFIQLNLLHSNLES